MIRIPLASRLVPVAALLAAVACNDATPTDPALKGTPPELQVTQAPDLANLARAIPGFGGLFIDHGVPTVYLTNPTDRTAMERALGDFASSRGSSAAQIQVLQGRYSLQELDRWTRQITTDAFSIAGVVYTDLDEAANRVTVGVDRASASSSVRSLAARLSIPAEAVVVKQTEPISLAATLRDQVRPVVAGLQINFSNFLCSIGFNAVSGGQNSFLTASHCTDRQGGVESTLYYQPLASTANSFIGTEVADPAYFRGGACPKGRKCRFSDASREAYASGVSFTLGGIAKTTGANNGSLTINGSFSITAEGSAVVGDVVNKIGRTTGWTQGAVSATCVNTGVSGSNIVQLCQTFVDAGVGGGDSGSDVFAQTGTSSATLLGILWGGNSSGTLFVYSPITNIEQELGPLTTH
jgi:hypothetical protein